ncbi:YqiJ family protein [Shewanella sp. D64]|uniref:OB-fold-containig protein n=1 Tax=unclassified Shewanella TaxID=196818 RepID=UPI0022BA220A|nr:MULTISPECIES: OB-fold-containig protein [unclassified Shewanella]MEC4727331.1 YqiJ family protein [Shewanella sp. D64]MEC4739486.1 YqiJ family protein [Shewanella sp. E94]WBJ96814.1 YqiJ family protein [Shewanella sp. MTB7]
MVEFLFTQANLPFSISLSFVLLLGIFEAFSLVVGYSLVGALDEWAPIDVDSDISTSGFTSVSGWLCLNRLPLLIWFVLVLVSFSLAGYTSNFLSLLLVKQTLPQIVSLPIALIFTAISCRYLGVSLARILPKNESSAVSIDTLQGCIATVTLGCAIKGNPSEALVRDKYQQRHYVLVEPEITGVEFRTGTQVVLLKRDGTVWSAAKFNS